MLALPLLWDAQLRGHRRKAQAPRGAQLLQAGRFALDLHGAVALVVVAPRVIEVVAHDAAGHARDDDAITSEKVFDFERAVSRCSQRRVNIGRERAMGCAHPLP